MKASHKIQKVPRGVVESLLVEVAWQMIFRGLKGSWGKALGSDLHRLEVLQKLGYLRVVKIG